MRMQIVLVAFLVSNVSGAVAQVADAAAQGERLRALIAEKAAYVAALEQGGESVDWALRNLAASEDPSSRADSPRSIDRCVGVAVVSC